MKNARPQTDLETSAAQATGTLPPTLTIISSEKPPRLTKRWRFDADGKPEQQPAGQVVQGRAEPQRAATPADLASLWLALEPNQAFCFGVPVSGQAHPIVTQAMVAQGKVHPDTIARDNDHFRWPAGTGWMMLDYDPGPGRTPLTQDELLDVLYQAAPALRRAPMVCGVSGSSYIYNSVTGEEITGLRGQRVYLLVSDARDIPRAGKALFDRLWLDGQGFYLVSKAGSLLERAPIDAAVWQVSRLDFAAAPVCKSPLETRRPDPQVRNHDAVALDTRQAIPNLTPSERERVEEIKAAARVDENLLSQQRTIRAAWVDERLKNIPSDLDDKQRSEYVDRLRHAVTDHRLWGDFELIHRTGQRVTVGQLLDDPARWHSERFSDPLEPDNPDKRVAWLNLRSGGRPYLYSHLHGGQHFTLLRPAQELRLARGENPRAITTILERLRTDGEVFERAGQLVRLADGALVPVERPWLQTHLETIFHITTYDGRAKEWRPSDCPDSLVARVMAARGAWKLPKVAGVVTFPIMRPDASVIVRPGFDEATRLLYLENSPHEAAPRPLNPHALRETLKRIWEPFTEFPFDSDLSRGVWLAALLTSACRPALPTAPAFLIRAYAPGTGKSLLSECLMLLVDAPLAALPLPENNPEEMEKRLFAKLLTGCAGMVMDNLTGSVNSAALCAMLTSAEPEGRILGKSEVVRQQNRALMVLNGNNVSLGGDLFRRILIVTLDANIENPELRRFTFDPREVIRERLQAYRTDLLSVLCTFQAEGAPQHGSGSFGSFTEWEQLVRQCVCWLIEIDAAPAPMVDPLGVLKLSKDEDPRHLQHIALLKAWYGVYGDAPVMVKDLAELIRVSELEVPTAKQALIDVLREVGCPTRNRGVFESRYFSGQLRRMRGTVVAGLRLDRVESDAKRGATWAVRMV